MFKILKNGLYLKSGLISILIFISLSIYIYSRRGFYDLYIINKALAGTAFVQIGLVLILGPLGRVYNFADRFLMYRKELGIIAFFYLFVHGILSLFSLPDHFPLSRFTALPASFIFGASGLIIFLTLFILSFDFTIKHINRKLWWQIQNWGVRIGGLFSLLHILPMKYQGWVNWYENNTATDLLRPFLPPAGLIVTTFGFYVLTIRIADMFFPKTVNKIIPILTYLLIAYLGFTFGWGITHS